MWADIFIFGPAFVSLFALGWLLFDYFRDVRKMQIEYTATRENPILREKIEELEKLVDFLKDANNNQSEYIRRLQEKIKNYESRNPN